MDNQLDISTLNEGFERKRQQKLEILKKVLNRCCSKIKFHSQMGKQWCIFNIPPYLIGYPLYKPIEAQRFLEMKLTEMGLLHKVIQANTLLIGWMHVPSEYTQSEDVDVSPWMNRGGY